MAKSLCIIGGGASGVGLAWILAKAQHMGIIREPYHVTILHDQDQLGGHSFSVPVTVNGTTYSIDLGVQVIAPTMYPTLTTMLNLPEFREVSLEEVKLKICCAFPPQFWKKPYWGNFPDYQDTDLFQAGKADCETFERLLKEKLESLEALLTLKEFLAVHESELEDRTRFENYFLDPYMSIMNGYGSALLGKLRVIEVAPYFDLGYASFTNVTEGFARFEKGSVYWVQTMANLARQYLGEKMFFPITNAVVKELHPKGEGPTVVWEHKGVRQPPQQFDVVVSTLDMETNGVILNNPTTNRRGGLWNWYSQYVGQQVWHLEPGYCYLHQDEGVLAPNVPDPSLPDPPGPHEETMQFTASWATVANPTPEKPYDLLHSFTTYVERNLMGGKNPPIRDPAFRYYLTMYGFDPAATNPGTRVPIPKDPISPTPMNWKHGMWLPFFMLDQKLRFHEAQSVSPYVEPSPKQKDTGIFFAGNNLTMDAEEGALISAMTVAAYSFGIDPLKTIEPPPGERGEEWAAAGAAFLAFYELMFHGSRDGITADALDIVRKLARVWTSRMDI